MIVFNEILSLLVPLMLCMLIQCFICIWDIFYGLFIPGLSFLFIIYKFYTSIVPTVSLYSYNWQIVLLHVCMLILYSSFFMVSFSIYLILKPS